MLLQQLIVNINSFITQFTELAIVKECNFSNDNFVYPARKSINENLTITLKPF